MTHPVTSLPDLRSDRALRDRLTSYLRESWASDASVAGLRRADGGFSNETWFLDIAAGVSTETVVLRRQALVGPLEPYDLGREAAILTALKQLSDVPVPEVYSYCGDPAVLGSPFTLIERLEGEIPDYRSLPEFPGWSDPRTRTRMAEEVLRSLALIQRARWREQPLASLIAAPDGDEPPVVGRVHFWLSKLERMVGGDRMLPVLRDAALWLIDNAPRDAERVFVHGDFRVGNFVWQGTTIVAVLDWEGAGVGDPFEDLGYMCHPMARVREPSLMGMLVPVEELYELFEAQLGRAVDRRRVHYYLIYALFFHLSTLVSGLASAMTGADLRAGLGYAKFAQTTRELIDHMSSYEEDRHVL
jgi:aminoglycoside phosphotransferase (APT) family kinase protein